MFRPIVTDNFEIIRATSPAHFGHTILDDPLAILPTFIILLACYVYLANVYFKVLRST